MLPVPQQHQTQGGIVVDSVVHRLHQLHVILCLSATASVELTADHVVTMGLCVQWAMSHLLIHLATLLPGEEEDMIFGVTEVMIFGSSVVEEESWVLGAGGDDIGLCIGVLHGVKCAVLFCGDRVTLLLHLGLLLLVLGV